MLKNLEHLPYSNFRWNWASSQCLGEPWWCWSWCGLCVLGLLLRALCLCWLVSWFMIFMSPTPTHNTGCLSCVWVPITCIKLHDILWQGVCFGLWPFQYFLDSRRSSGSLLLLAGKVIYGIYIPHPKHRRQAPFYVWAECYIICAFFFYESAEKVLSYARLNCAVFNYFYMSLGQVRHTIVVSRYQTIERITRFNYSASVRQALNVCS